MSEELNNKINEELDDYVDGYVLPTNEGDYTPSAHEKFLILDAIIGWREYEDSLRAPSEKPISEDVSAINEANNALDELLPNLMDVADKWPNETCENIQVIVQTIRRGIKTALEQLGGE